jgi:hypothetical protein
MQANTTDVLRGGYGRFCQELAAGVGNRPNDRIK